MSLQDSIFDVAAALDGKPEAFLFEEVMEHFHRVEDENNIMRARFKTFRDAITLIKRM